MADFPKLLVNTLSPVRPKQVRMASGLGDIATTLRGGVQLGKQLYEPLARRGVSWRQDNGWTSLDLTDGILKAIKDNGLLNYKRGGHVRALSRKAAGG